jgi:hypothetical protein
MKMILRLSKIVLCLVLFIIVSVATTVPEFCTLSDSEIPTCSKNEEIFKTLDWWEKMSVKKPIQCKTPKHWILQSPLLKLFSKQMPVVSLKCKHNQTPTKYSFKGQIKDGRLEGLGKLKLGETVLAGGEDQTCLKVNLVLGQQPSEIIATFVNGCLHGVAKIVLSGGRFIIGNYINGLADGFQREWNEDGSLTYAGFSHQGARIGKAWYRTGKSLVYDDIATINRSDDLTVVVPLEPDSITSKVLSGRYWPHISTLHDIYQTKLNNVELEDQSCFIKVTTEIESEGSDDFFYDVKHDKVILKHSEGNQALCKLLDNQDGNVSDKLIGWFKEINLDLPNIHQTLLQMRIEISNPKSEEKLISEVLFNDETVDSDPRSPPAAFNITFFETERSKTFVGVAGFDSQGRFHGLVELKASFNKSLEHKFGFELKHVDSVRAVFSHGEIDGPAIIKTKVCKTFN